MMKFNKNKYLTILNTMGVLFFVSSVSFAFDDVVKPKVLKGNASLVGSIIASPCSIEMEDRYQYIQFGDISLSAIDNKVKRENLRKKFYIRLSSCVSQYSDTDKKALNIQFNGLEANNDSIFSMSGSSNGLGFYILDEDENIITPNKPYYIDHLIYHTKDAKREPILNYQIELAFTNQIIEAGKHSAFVYFSIDYK
ncbi:type 1 fimbrial protein [Proteus mirabilis]|uniref:Fimbrial protein n=2 Tax=Morganellaceae TaxID=1903414 RepID=A0A6G6SDT6_PROVU|nr:fimbrial protein [Proteus vulgaris]MBG3080874.1 type 1 fimbrial protein [Proteus mirabilis]QIF92683.1 fimbrial protein [Proteus vulgaris]QPN90258.1 type 1 fimbrial protein [Proteus vulgaris]WIF72676.1 fimbrial protein [Proteus vulgaris]